MAGWKNFFKFGKKDKEKEIESKEELIEEVIEEKVEEKKELEQEVIEETIEYEKNIIEEKVQNAEKIQDEEKLQGSEVADVKEQEEKIQNESIEEKLEEEVIKEKIENLGEDIEEIDSKYEVEFVEEDKPEKKSFFARLKEGLSKTRNGITKQIDNVFKAFGKIDEELFEELEEVLITSDVGVETSLKIIENLRKKAKEKKLTESHELKGLLKDEIRSILGNGVESIINENGKPTIILVMGVNGVGKTTTIGKMGYKLSKEGKKVLFAAADTFRAAAIDQLEIWGKRTKVDVIKHNEGSDPAAVIFDAIKAAKARKTDVLICDTAGRLHNKKNLMEELKKIWRVIEREYPEANKEVYLALDATTGQNALSQAKLFGEVAQITGMILTKLDGTAKGGIVIAIKDQMDIPVKLIGVGEKMYDLQEFNPTDFVSALFDEE